MYKKLFLFSLVLLMCLSFAFSTNAASQTAEFTLKCGSIVPIGGIQSRAMDWVMNEIEKRSDGMLKIDYYPANQLGSTDEQFDSIITGTIDLFITGGNTMEAMGKEYAIDAIPFIFRNEEHRLAYQNSELNKERHEKTLERNGVRVIADNWYYQPHILLSTKPISKPEDLDGFKMRVPASRAQFIGWKEIGTNPVTMPFGDVYLALKQGVIDGVSDNFEAIVEDHFTEVASNVIMLKTEFGYEAVMVNEKSYQKLPENLRSILVETFKEGGDIYSKYDEQEADVVRKYIEENNDVKVFDVDNELFRERIKGLSEKLEKEGIVTVEELDKIKDL